MPPPKKYLKNVSYPALKGGVFYVGVSGISLLERD